MVIRSKSSLNKVLYEKIGQKQMFGRDNIYFKTVNHPLPQRYKNLCSNFRIKKIEISFLLSLPLLKIKN